MAQLDSNILQAFEKVADEHRDKIIDVGTDWVIAHSEDLGGARPRQESRELVAQVVAFNLDMILRNDRALQDEFIEYVTTLRASAGFQISTLLRGFLSFRIGIEDILDELQIEESEKIKILRVADENYSQSIFTMSNVYVSKLYEKMEAQASELVDSNRLLEAAMAHRMETNQALLEHMVSVSALSELAEKFAATSTEQGLLDATACEARRIAGSQVAYVDLMEGEQHGFRQYCLHPVTGAISMGRKPFVAGSLVDEVFKSGRAQWCNEATTSEDPRWVELSGTKFQSVFLVPIMASRTPLGVMSLLAQSDGHFNDWMRPVTEQMCSMLGTNLALRQVVSVLQSSLRTADSVLVNMFPALVAGRLKSGENDIADKVECAGIFFCDLAGFTSYASQVNPDVTLHLLRGFFDTIEEICERRNVEKIKTIGDAFMAVSGVSLTVDDPIETIALFALDVAKEVSALLAQLKVPLNFRIGIHSGPLIAGVIGKSRATFDVWGDSVNMASRLESHAPHGEIACSREVFNHLRERYHFAEHEKVHMKGMGEQPFWLVRGRKE